MARDGQKFVSLATELVIAVLLQLGLRDLLRCKQVCRRLKTLIDDSLELQYKIECMVFGVVDGNAKVFTLGERLSRLRALQRAWRENTPSEQFTVNVEGDEDCVLSGNIFGYIDESTRRALHFVQIPSLYRNIPKKVWEITALPYDIYLFDVDHHQRLLLAVEKYDSNSQEWRVHILSSETGCSHPQAKRSAIIMHLDEGVGRWWTGHDMHISGDSFGLSLYRNVSDGENRSELWVWNWKTSELQLHIYDLEDKNFVFADDHHIMVSMFPPEEDEYPPQTGPMLVVLSLGDNSRASLETAARRPDSTIFLLEPPLWSVYTSVSIQMDYNAGPPPDTKVPFHWDPDLRFFLVHLDLISFQTVNSRKPSTKVPTCSRRSLLVPYNVIRDRVRRIRRSEDAKGGNDAVMIPWNEWSPEVFALSDKARVMGVSRSCALIQYDVPGSSEDPARMEVEHTAIFDLNAHPVKRNPFLSPQQNSLHTTSTNTTPLEASSASLWKKPRIPHHRRYDWPAQEDVGVLIDDAFISKVMDPLRDEHNEYWIRAF